MYISNITLSGYKSFEFSKIKELSIDLSTDPILMLLGSNGSGKSSLLRECIPSPSVRTSFNKSGYMHMELEHDGNKYTLMSDFSNNTSPHSFAINGEELNTSGATKIQTELIEKYIGLTNTKYKLLTIGYNLAEMSPGIRKNLLLNLNPTNMGLILEKHKAISTKIRAFKNNLNLLYKRKEDISSQLIKENIYTEIKKNKTILENKKNVLTMWIYAIQTHISNLEKQEIDTHIDLSDLKKELKNISRQSIDYKHIDRSKYTKEYHKYKSDLQTLSYQIKESENSVLKIIKELEEYKQHTTNAEKSSSKSDLENKIKELEKIDKSIDIDMDKFQPFSENDIDLLSTYMDKLSDILNTFLEYPLVFTDRTKSNKIDMQLNTLKYRVSDLSSMIHGKIQELDKLNSKKIDAAVQIPRDCDFDTCGLKNLYKDKVKEHKEQIKKLDNEINNFNKKLDRYKRAIVKLSKYYQKVSTSISNYHRLKDLISDIPSLNVIFRSINKDKLNTQPLLVINDIKNHIKLSSDYIKKKSIREELSLLKKQIEKLKDSNTLTLDFLLKIIKDKEVYLDKVRNNLTTMYKKRDNISNMVKRYKAYIADRDYLTDIQKSFDLYVYEVEKKYSILYYQKLTKVLQDMSTEIDSKLIDINHTVKEQDGLKDRLEKEICNMISEIEKDKAKYELLEIALSPTTGIPHKYMVNFLNGIITNMNKFIKKVWTYKFELLLLDENKPIDYTFKIKVGDVIVNDISTCSSGQKTIINLAFALSMIIRLDLHNYPMFVDEIDRYLDTTHAQKLLELFNELVNSRLISQLIMINHNSIMEGIQSSTVVLDDRNILVPPNYNEHVKIKKY